jgi:hypothetical protein
MRHLWERDIDGMSGVRSGTAVRPGGRWWLPVAVAGAALGVLAAALEFGHGLDATRIVGPF